MEIKVAKTAGFCYGVQRAVDMVQKALSDGEKKIYTYGPIVHNDIVVNELKEKGVGVIEDFGMLQKLCGDGSLAGAALIIRAHGVGKDVYELIESAGCGIRLMDATCPYVRKIHKIVREHYENGEQIVVTGSKKHPEVVGILGQIGGDAAVLESVSDAENVRIDPKRKLCLVSQTTFSIQKFEDIVAIFAKKQYNMDVINTICNATQMRQTEAAELSAECDAMIVIGGKNSSNTAKLCDICQAECKNTYFIQSKDDLDDSFHSVRCVGITAGASTPKSIIEEVLKYVRDEF